MNLQIQRMQALPLRPDRTWEGGIVRVPARVRQEDGSPILPLACMWVTDKADKVNMSQVAAEIPPQAVLTTLAELATDSGLAGYRPGKVQVSDAALAEFLRPLLEEIGIAVELKSELPHLASVLRQLDESMKSDEGMPSGLGSEPGMTRERLHAFAEAAQAFYSSRPWTKLTGEDLIHIAAPRVDKGMRYFTVMGAGGETYGLSFFPSMDIFERLLSAEDPLAFIQKHPLWSVMFDTSEDLPPSEAAAWVDWKLPVAGPRAYPFASRFRRGKWERPAPDELATMEGVLRAMASVTELQLDAGQWTATVSTADGPVAFSFEMEPDSDFDPVELGNVASAEDPRQAALELVEQAQLAQGRQQLRLLRDALAADPNCAAAYVSLAYNTADPAEARRQFQLGMEAAARALEPDSPAALAGKLWETRDGNAYLRCMGGIADTLQYDGKPQEACQLWRQMLTLDPVDHLKVRHGLADYFALHGMDKELAALLEQFKHDRSAPLLWHRVLLSYRRHGDSAESRQALFRAITANRSVADFLTGKREILSPDDRPEYMSQKVEEAMEIVEYILPAWQATPGVIDWLSAHVPKKVAKRKRK